MLLYVHQKRGGLVGAGTVVVGGGGGRETFTYPEFLSKAVA